jgi:UDP-N-acetyl-D-glucosamine dehydrogenase
VLTDHDDFDYELVERDAAYVLDTRRRIRGPRVEHL